MEAMSQGAKDGGVTISKDEGYAKKSGTIQYTDL